MYKRVKQGILDGSLAKHNLGEIIYNPLDFIEIETAIFKTVNMLLTLSKTAGAVAGQEQAEKDSNGAANHNPALTVAFDSKTITPAGDKPPYVVDAPPPAGPRPSTTGSTSRSKAASAKMTMLATKQALSKARGRRRTSGRM